MRQTLKSRQKEESREKILKSAAKLFKVQGFAKTGVDELMETAGLTAGAFYAHFDSKNQLLQESLRYTLEKSRKSLLAGADKLSGDQLITQALKNYVSSGHRDHPEMGCAIPALAAELAQNGLAAKKVVGEYVERWISFFTRHRSGPSVDARREESIQLICQAVGALLLSRQVADPKLSEEILLAAQKVRTKNG